VPYKLLFFLLNKAKWKLENEEQNPAALLLSGNK